MKLYIIAAQPEENNTQARLTERCQFAMVKNMETIAITFGGLLFSQMKGKLCFLSRMTKKKVWRRMDFELDEKSHCHNVKYDRQSGCRSP